MITRHLLKREIDKVRDEHLTALYNIMKVFELPAGEVLYKDMLELQERNAAGQLEFLSHKEVWSAGKEETYGSAD